MLRDAERTVRSIKVRACAVCRLCTVDPLGRRTGLHGGLRHAYVRARRDGQERRGGTPRRRRVRGRRDLPVRVDGHAPGDAGPGGARGHRHDRGRRRRSGLRVDRGGVGDGRRRQPLVRRLGGTATAGEDYEVPAEAGTWRTITAGRTNPGCAGFRAHWKTHVPQRSETLVQRGVDAVRARRGGGRRGRHGAARRTRRLAAGPGSAPSRCARRRAHDGRISYTNARHRPFRTAPAAS